MNDAVDEVIGAISCLVILYLIFAIPAAIVIAMAGQKYNDDFCGAPHSRIGLAVMYVPCLLGSPKK